MVVFELVEAFTEASIFIEKVDHLVGTDTLTLMSHPNHGIFAELLHLRSDFVKHREALKEQLSTVSIVTDKVSDSQLRSGLHIMYLPQIKDSGSALKFFVGNIIFLSLKLIMPNAVHITCNACRKYSVLLEKLDVKTRSRWASW